MMKLVPVILFVLIGLDLIVGGIALITPATSLIIAGVLLIILAIVLAMKMKCEVKTPTK